MKRLLIISEIFAPQSSIGALRPTKLAKYLKLTGRYEITVLTNTGEAYPVDESALPDTKYPDTIIRVPYCKASQWLQNCLAFVSAFYQKHFASSKHTAASGAKEQEPARETLIAAEEKPSLAGRCYTYLYDFLAGKWHARKMFRALLRNSKRPYDVIFSTYNPLAPHYVALLCKKEWPSAKWIADFRDAVYLPELSPVSAKPASNHYTMQISQNADLITIISPPMIEDMVVSPQCPVKVLYNGYDPQECGATGCDLTSHFTFCYTGGLHGGKRDLTSFFRALHELAQEKKIQLERIQIHYAGRDIQPLIKAANVSGMKHIIVDHGLLPRQKALYLQQHSHILLLASWNDTTGIAGILTGKFLEYLGSGRPVLCLVSGNKPESLLKEMIQQYNLGFCREEAEEGDDITSLKSYILQQYNGYIKYGSAPFTPNQELIEQHSYPALAAQLESYF